MLFIVVTLILIVIIIYLYYKKKKVMDEYFQNNTINDETLEQYEKNYTESLLENHRKINYLDNKLRLTNEKMKYNVDLTNKYEKYNYIMKMVTVVSVVLLICMICIYVINKGDFSFINTDSVRTAFENTKNTVQKSYKNFLNSLKPVKKLTS
jgi:NADH:ubiquinone oxidoreductase subunit 6 (subunit J)